MTWLVVFLVMLLVVFGMSIGVIMGRKPIAGSCGGIANLGIVRNAMKSMPTRMSVPLLPMMQPRTDGGRSKV